MFLELDKMYKRSRSFKLWLKSKNSIVSFRWFDLQSNPEAAHLRRILDELQIGHSMAFNKLRQAMYTFVTD